MDSPRQIWIFHATGARFAGGAFEDAAMAEVWIEKHNLTGVLTAYPVDEGCFDWAVRAGKTNLNPEKLTAKSLDPAFVGGFTSGSQMHVHFEAGKRV